MTGKRVYIRPFELKDSEVLLQLQEKNRAFFEEFSMGRPDDFYSLEGQKKRISDYEKWKKMIPTINLGYLPWTSMS